MHFFTIVLQALCGASVVSAASLPRADKTPAKPLPLDRYNRFHTISEDDAKGRARGSKHHPFGGRPKGAPTTEEDETLNTTSSRQPNTLVNFNTLATAADCTSNPPYRFEWRRFVDADKAAYTDAIRCLMDRPASGRFSPARNRYEDFVVLHQRNTPSVHQNHFFLLWHRYYLWTFEQVLRSECGYNKGAFPWWDETLDAGRFAQSTIFTNTYFGSLPGPTGNTGTCITDGKFRNTELLIGPGTGTTRRCLSRARNEGTTASTGASYVKTCFDWTTFTNMASCSELGPHGAGHNGIGGDMSDFHTSVNDPVFFLHHTFIDHNYRIWQNVDPVRRTTIQGCADGNNPCRPLTLDTVISVGGIRPDVRVRDVLDTLSPTLCYRYDY